jgi:hypothetical protein
MVPSTSEYVAFQYQAAPGQIFAGQYERRAITPTAKDGFIVQQREHSEFLLINNYANNPTTPVIRR